MAPVIILGKALAGGLVVLLGWDPAKDHHLLKGVSDLECLHKDLHATTGMSPESLPHGGSGLKGDSLRRCGASCHGKGLAGFAKTASRQGSCRGVRFVPFALCGLGLGVVLLLLSFGLTLAHLPCLAQCGGARGSDCPCIVIGVQKVYPSFCTPTGAPGPGPHISATRCWARPKNSVRAGGAVFTAVSFFARCASHASRAWCSVGRRV